MALLAEELILIRTLRRRMKAGEIDTRVETLKNKDDAERQGCQEWWGGVALKR